MFAGWSSGLHQVGYIELHFELVSNQDVCRQFASETSGKKKYELFMQVRWAPHPSSIACKQWS